MTLESDRSHHGRRLEIIRLVVALRRKDAVKGFWIHFAAFVLVMPLLLIINVVASPGWWVQWPFLGWGIGVAVHALAVFGLGGWLSPAWEQKKVREYMDEQDRAQV